MDYVQPIADPKRRSKPSAGLSIAQRNLSSTNENQGLLSFTEEKIYFKLRQRSSGHACG